MEYTVIFSAQSNRDLARVVLFLAQKNPGAAERLGHAIVDQCLSLRVMPNTGAPVARRLNVRRIPHRRWFVIYYRVDEVSRTVEIIRIWDARQNPTGLSGVG